MGGFFSRVPRGQSHFFSQCNCHNFAHKLVCFVRQHQQKSLFTPTSAKISTNQYDIIACGSLVESLKRTARKILRTRILVSWRFISANEADYRWTILPTVGGRITWDNLSTWKTRRNVLISASCVGAVPRMRMEVDVKRETFRINRESNYGDVIDCNIENKNSETPKGWNTIFAHAARSGCGCLSHSIERRSQQLHDAWRKIDCANWCINFNTFE